jgi:hypothetical protein
LKTVLSGSTSTVAVVFVIVTADEARELTGLDLDELSTRYGVETLRRFFPDGRVEDAVKVQRELILDSGYRYPTATRPLRVVVVKESAPPHALHLVTP